MQCTVCKKKVTFIDDSFFFYKGQEYYIVLECPECVARFIRKIPFEDLEVNINLAKAMQDE